MQQDNFIYLLVALLVFLVGLPVMDELRLIPGEVVLPIAVSCLLAIGVWSLRDSKRRFRIGMVLAVTGIVASLAAVATDSDAIRHLSSASLFAFLLLAIVSAARQVVVGVQVNTNRLFGAVCVYLMLGILWAILYEAANTLNPESFSGVEASAPTGSFLQWIYYSFVTLTTLGYGDISPVGATARVLAYSEAIFGVFYMAVLVAALVSAYASENGD